MFSGQALFYNFDTLMSSVLISDLTAERMPPPSRRPDRSEVLQFDHNKLQHVPVTEKVVLPSQQGINKYI